MWSPAIRAGRRHALQQIHRKVLFRRSYNGQNGPHTTYFQQPPETPRKAPSRTGRIIRSIIYFSAGVLLGGNAILSEFGEGEVNLLQYVLHYAQATTGVALGEAEVNDLLKTRSSCQLTLKAVSHTAQLPSNLPCEDTVISVTYNVLKDFTKEWSLWAIFDGHAGSRTSHRLQRELPQILGDTLSASQCFNQPYEPENVHIINTIKNAFQSMDDKIIAEAAWAIDSNKALAEKVVAAAPAFSGSCALVALFDPVQSVLRVANVGDSRAVLGRWDDSTGGYVAMPLSVDQTGFNPDEVARLAREHPDEEVVDPRTGRVHGIAVSRAFGDARWKWTEAFTKKAHDLVWGPPPRPKQVIKTPPYLIAEPEIMETKIQTGEHPDFLIMASDGLWDQISSSDAVTAVELWLSKNEPDRFISEMTKNNKRFALRVGRDKNEPRPKPITMPKDRVGAFDDDTYYEEDGSLKWRVSPKHFSNDTEQCAEHLIKNALGGTRKDLLTGVASVQPPLSRNVRDDITVQVVFFGYDAQKDPRVYKMLQEQAKLSEEMKKMQEGMKR